MARRELGLSANAEAFEDPDREVVTIPLLLRGRPLGRIVDVVPIEDVVEDTVLPRCGFEVVVGEIVDEHLPATPSLAVEDERVEEVEGDGLDGPIGPHAIR